LLWELILSIISDTGLSLQLAQSFSFDGLLPGLEPKLSCDGLLPGLVEIFFSLKSGLAPS
jgi:hypothetical protein